MIFAYEPTAHLAFMPVVVAFVMGGLGMVAPVQGGLGPWHYMVIHSLAIYGLPNHHGEVFALVTHTSINLVVLIAGLLSMFLIFKLNTQKKK